MTVSSNPTFNDRLRAPSGAASAAFSFPVHGAIVVAQAPAGMRTDVRASLVRTAMNAVAAQIALKRRLDRPAGYAKAVFDRGARSWSSGQWDAWQRSHMREEERLEAIRFHPADLELDELMQVLLGAYDTTDTRVASWTYVLLGHELGQHQADCQVCVAASRRDWWLVLRVSQLDPRTLRNFRDALWDGHFIGSADYERAKVEIAWARRDPDAF